MEALERIWDLWWYRLPMAASRLSRPLALALSDGLYLTAWPAVAAVCPPIALLLGFLIGWLQQAPNNSYTTYTASLALLGLMIAVSSFGASLGGWVWLGYVIGNFLLAPHHTLGAFRLLDDVVDVRVPLIITYLLLAILLINIPAMSTAIRRATLARVTYGTLRTLLEPALQAVVSATFVGVWALAAPTLIRPLFFWQANSGGSVGAVAPLQHDGWILVALAAAVGALRTMLEYAAGGPTEAAGENLAFRRALASASTVWVLPNWAVAAAQSVAATLLLAGLMSSWLDALVFFVLTFAIGYFGFAIVDHSGPWVWLWAKVPVILRVAGGIVVSFALASLITTVTGLERSFLPVAIASAVTFLVFVLIFPDRGRFRRDEEETWGYTR